MPICIGRISADAVVLARGSVRQLERIADSARS